MVDVYDYVSASEADWSPTAQGIKLQHTDSFKEHGGDWSPLVKKSPVVGVPLTQGPGGKTK
jgi:hypothetical protein